MCRSPCSSAITRSASVMIPTQRPPSLTTGTPGSSWSLSSRTTSSTLASGETVTGSRSMMSATVATPRSLSAGGSALSAGGGQRGDHVRGDHALGTDALGGDPAGARVQVDGRTRGGERVELLGQHRGEYTGEH